MKRRIFLSAASTVGIVGAVSSASLVSSAYSSINTSVLLEDFGATSRRVLNKFIDNLRVNFTSNGADELLAEKMAMPVKIIRNTVKGVTYKNKAGDLISLSVKDGEALVVINPVS